MGVPSDQLMKMMQSQKDGATPGGLPAPDASGAQMSDASAPPMGSPMSTPEPKMGNREAAMINIASSRKRKSRRSKSFGRYSWNEQRNWS